MHRKVEAFEAENGILSGASSVSSGNLSEGEGGGKRKGKGHAEGDLAGRKGGSERCPREAPNWPPNRREGPLGQREAAEGGERAGKGRGRDGRKGRERKEEAGREGGQRDK